MFRHYLFLYRRYVGISLRSQMQYRASFLMLTFAQLFATSLDFLGIAILFARFGNLRGWELREIALFYGITHTAFALAEGIGRGFDLFGNLVKSGDFDRLLLRPMPTALQVAGQEFQLMRVGRLIQGTAVLCWSVVALGLYTAPAKLLLVLLCIFGGSCLFYGIFVVQATLAFWTVESLEIMNTLTYGGTETAAYPLTIYRPWFRAFFTFLVPLACINYLPAGLLFDRAHASVSPQWWHTLLPLVGVLFLFVAFRIWRFGERHYCSTGS